MPSSSQRFEHKDFVFIPGQLRPRDYTSMREQGWYVVGKSASVGPNQIKVITLVFERDRERRLV